MAAIKKLNVYLSVSLQVSHQVVEKIIEDVEMIYDISCTRFKRGTPYTGKDLERADALAVYIPDNGWSTPITALTRGVRSEIQVALDRGIPIFIAYLPQSGDGDYRLYKATTAGDRLGGIAGTSSAIRDVVSKSNSKKLVDLRELDFDFFKRFEEAGVLLHDRSGKGIISQITYFNPKKRKLLLLL
jgi:hypothetical protein